MFQIFALLFFFSSKKKWASLAWIVCMLLINKYLLEFICARVAVCNMKSCLRLDKILTNAIKVVMKNIRLFKLSCMRIVSLYSLICMINHKKLRKFYLNLMEKATFC